MHCPKLPLVLADVPPPSLIIVNVINVIVVNIIVIVVDVTMVVL